MSRSSTPKPWSRPQRDNRASSLALLAIRAGSEMGPAITNLSASWTCRDGIRRSGFDFAQRPMTPRQPEIGIFRSRAHQYL